MKDYHINIFFSDEDEGYIADIPDLVHCSAFGTTPEAALAEVLVAKAAWLEAARAEAKPVPPPTYRPANLPGRLISPAPAGAEHFNDDADALRDAPTIGIADPPGRNDPNATAWPVEKAE